VHEQVAGLDSTLKASTEGKTSEACNLNEDFLRRLDGLNPICADCGSQHPNWASINFGIMICIECSGIHRSLGVHVSKVRSLTLDTWSRTQRSIMEAIGNETFNGAWEKDIPPGRSKPAASASRDEREAWIRDKYLRKAFVKESWEDPDRLLFAAAAAGDLPKILWCLAHGADVNAIDDEHRDRTPMHVVCQEGHLLALEMLFQNGGNLDVADADEVTPLDLGMKAGDNSLIAFVLSKLERDGPYV
jgi:hypothetical protein